MLSKTQHRTHNKYIFQLNNLKNIKKLVGGQWKTNHDYTMKHELEA